VGATLKELDRVPRSGLPSNLHYTGPALPAATPARPHGGETRILVSLSTTYLPGQATVLQNILDALADLSVKVIVTTGPAVASGSLRVPANAEAHDYLPHAEVMPDVSLVIGHGGHSTTMLALAHDLPLLILPMNLVFDQPLIGQAIQRVGAGKTIAAKSQPGEIRAAVQLLLADASFRREAARLGGAIRESRGAQAAADLVLALIPQTPTVRSKRL
jgi:MGT family glycosyltransferase